MAVEFNKKCPNCGGTMAEGNKYCCKKCYEFDMARKKKIGMIRK